MTDGHIDFYSSAKHTNASLVGRVPIQVKGRVARSKLKASRDSKKFKVERDVLQFFRNHGGGLYFYVSMQSGGKDLEIFYANLLPHKIGRILEHGPTEQTKFDIKLSRLPEDPAKVEAIVSLAWRGRGQSSHTINNGHVIEQAESLTVYSLTGINESHPTRLVLAETDYVVVAHLPGGVDVSIDSDLEILPPQYVQQELAMQIGCGTAAFESCSVRRTDEETVLVQLAEGLELLLTEADGSLGVKLQATATGSLRERAKILDFMLAAAGGKPLVIGARQYRTHEGDPESEGELAAARHELALLIELFDFLGIDDVLTRSIVLDDETKRTLMAFHEGILREAPVRGTANGVGRFDIVLNQFKIMLVIFPSDKDGYWSILDPFDPTKRDRYRIYGNDPGAKTSEGEFATVYEVLTSEDLAQILNLRLDRIVETYKALPDQSTALRLAVLLQLRLLAASDLTGDEFHRAQLLRGASFISEWLLVENSSSLIDRINWWQIQSRLGSLRDEDHREIRLARRTLDRSDRSANLQEVCLLILINDLDELAMVVAELNSNEIDTLRSWPVWALLDDQSQASLIAQIETTR